MRRDLFLIERADPRAARERDRLAGRRAPARRTTTSTRSATSRCSPRSTSGELGIDALNGALRDALNPDGEPVRGGRLRIGDKLMMTGRNLHELGLMNGTLLRLVDEVAGAPTAPTTRR